MAHNPNFTAITRNDRIPFTDAQDVRPRVLFEAGTSVANDTNNPTVFRAGGSRIHAISIASSSASNINVFFHLARRKTSVANMGTASFATNNTITRTTGSFITDGWVPGETFFVAPSAGDTRTTTAAANGAVVTVTTVADLTLTVSGTPFVSTPQALPAGFGLWAFSQLGYVPVPAGAGNGTVPAVSALQTAQLPILDESPNRFLTLGVGDALTARLGTALAANTFIDISIFAADY